MCFLEKLKMKDLLEVMPMIAYVYIMVSNSLILDLKSWSFKTRVRDSIKSWVTFLFLSQE